MSLAPQEINEIKQTLLLIYDKIQNQHTKEVGYDIFKKLIEKCNDSEQKLSIIIQQLSEYITGLTLSLKEPGFKLLSFFFLTKDESLKENKFSYIPVILSILQNLIQEKNSSLFPLIASTYAEIVQNTMKTEIENYLDEMSSKEKKAYETLQGFCIYNMKKDNKAQKIVGSLCLTKLVENCPIVLQQEYMKFLWGNLMQFIEKKNFCAKYEVLNCLISLILGGETLFKPYAADTVYRIIEYFTDDDWLKRKLALNILYTIAYYCMPEISEMKEQIKKFLKLLKTDKVKEVREVAMSILKLFNNEKDSNARNLLGFSGESVNLSINKEKSPARNIPKREAGNNGNTGNNTNARRPGSFAPTVVSKKPTHKRSEAKSLRIRTNEKEPGQPGIPVLTAPSKGFLFLDKRISSNKSNDGNFSDDGRVKTMEVNNPNNPRKSFQKMSRRQRQNDSDKRSCTPNVDIKRRNNNANNNNSPPRFKHTSSGTLGFKENNGHNGNSNSNDFVFSGTNNLNVQNKKVEVSRKNDGTFVNEKMVIKTDPKKSVFNTVKNQAFFNKAGTGGDVILVSKKKDEDNQTQQVNNYVVSKKPSKPEFNKQGNSNKFNNRMEIEEGNNKSYDNSNPVNNGKMRIEDLEGDEFGEDFKKEKPKSKSKTNRTQVNNQVNNQLNQVDEDQENEGKNSPSPKKPFSKYNSKDNINNTPGEADDYSKNNTQFNKENNQNQNNNSSNSALIKTLLSKMNSLSSKQVELLDTLQATQSETQSTLGQMNSKINNLNSTISDLLSQIAVLKNNKSIPNPDNQAESNINEIIKRILSQDKEEELLNFLSNVSIQEIKTISIKNLEDTVIRLITILSQGRAIKQIISFYKTVVLALKINFRRKTLENIQEILEYISSEENAQYYKLTDDEILDINILLQHLQR